MTLFTPFNNISSKLPHLAYFLPLFTFFYILPHPDRWVPFSVLRGHARSDTIFFTYSACGAEPSRIRQGHNTKTGRVRSDGTRLCLPGLAEPIWHPDSSPATIYSYARENEAEVGVEGALGHSAAGYRRRFLDTRGSPVG